MPNGQNHKMLWNTSGNSGGNFIPNPAYQQMDQWGNIGAEYGDQPNWQPAIPPSWQMPDIAADARAANNLKYPGNVNKPGIPEAGMDKFGAAKLGVQAFGSLATLWANMRAYGVAENQLAENQRQFGMNYAAQKNTTNERLSSMFAARDAARGQSTAAEQMARYGIA